LPKSAAAVHRAEGFWPRPRRELHDDPGAAEGAVLDADLATVARDDGPDDREPEAAATLGSGAAVVEAGESLEDSFAVADGWIEVTAGLDGREEIRLPG
jgi:hypothetical protein